MFWILPGNGTLNKQAGIDYKQLSLLAKINENQSGEVSTCCQAIIECVFFSFSKSALLFNWLAVLYTVMARSMARRRDHSEGAAGEGLDHQEEQRLQWGTPETQVILTRPFWGSLLLAKALKTFASVLPMTQWFAAVDSTCWKFLKTSFLLGKQSHNRREMRWANLKRGCQHCES